MAKGDTAPEAPYRRRLGEAAGSLGRPLREIEGEEVVVTAITVEGGRKVRAQGDRPDENIKKGDLMTMDAVVITVESSDPHGTRYFSFSQSLVEKLRGINPDELPMDARFVTRDIGSGQRVWDVE